MEKNRMYQMEKRAAGALLLLALAASLVVPNAQAAIASRHIGANTAGAPFFFVVLIPALEYVWWRVALLWQRPNAPLVRYDWRAMWFSLAFCEVMSVGLIVYLRHQGIPW